MIVDELTVGHQTRQLALQRLTVQAMAAVWPLLDWTRLDDTFAPWALAAGQIIIPNREISAGLASAYIRTLREDAGADGEPAIVLPEPVDGEQLLTSLRVTAIVAAKRAAIRGADRDTAMQAAFVQSAGAASRVVLEGGRRTIVRTVNADPAARGWQRVTRPAACQFCRMLAGRGAVYQEDTAGFESHDACGCLPKPVYDRAAA